jgi:5'(3')-deoxyribonucleotidase
MKIKQIYLDMDGVVVDLHTAFLANHGFVLTEENWPVGYKKGSQVMGMSQEEFDAPIMKAGATFWQGLKPYGWFEEFWQELNAIAPVCYLSSPEYGPGCAGGKVKWMQERHGEEFGDFVLTSRKELLAAPGCVLIDDTIRNLEKFEAAGGRGVLFERPWNTPGSRERAPHKQVLAQLKALATH